MSSKHPPEGPVDTVDTMCVTGARVMHGTWPNGETHVFVGEIDYAEGPLGMGLAADAGALPIDLSDADLEWSE
jgi:hypothetical protein